MCFEKEKKKDKNQIWSLQLKRAEIKWNVNKINEISITYEWFALQQKEISEKLKMVCEVIE